MSYGGIMWSKAKGQITFHTPVESWQRDRKNPPSCHLGFTKFLTTLESPAVFSQVRHHNHQNGPNALWQGLWLTHCLWGFLSVVQVSASFPWCAWIFCPQLCRRKRFDSALTVVSLSYEYNFICTSPSHGAVAGLWFSLGSQPSQEHFPWCSTLTWLAGCSSALLLYSIINL